MTDVTVRPDALVADRWEPARPTQRCRRVVDINHYRQEVRWWCDKCRATHTQRVGAVS